MKSKKQAQSKFSPGKAEREIAPILGVNVSSRGKEEVLKEALRLVEANKVSSSQARNELKIIITPKPEIVYRASYDSGYRDVLNKADLSMTDGVGIVWARRFLSMPVSRNFVPMLFFEALSLAWDTIATRRNEVVPGRLIFEELVREGSERGWKIFLLGGGEGVAEKTTRVISERFDIPNAKIQFEAGPWLDNGGKPQDEEQLEIEHMVIKKINKFKPDLLFVAFGPPKQEIWLDRNKSKLKASVAMVVGGTFDYISGKVPTPPQFITNLNLEWAWRLFTQPQRVGRVFTAIVKFPLRVIGEKLTQ